MSWAGTRIAVIDDGSTDKGVEIFRGYEDRPIRIISKTTAGFHLPEISVSRCLAVILPHFLTWMTNGDHYIAKYSSKVSG